MDLRNKVKIALIHPDLGIGGAERLMVDIAIGLQNLGHTITIHTNFFDPNHCFKEDCSQLKIETYAQGIPNTFFNKFYILINNLKQIYLILYVLFFYNETYDFFIIDQNPISILFIFLYRFWLKLFINILILDEKRYKIPRCLFYCHFPDQNLAKRDSNLKKIYRIPFDFIEEFSLYFSDKIFVNSNFTKKVFNETFTWLSKKSNNKPLVIYPCVDLSKIPQNNDFFNEFGNFLQNKPNFKYFLSINRFERKKNIELAIKSFSKIPLLNDESKNIKLLVSGGYDSKVIENVEYLKELENLTKELQLSSTIINTSTQKFSYDLISNYQVIFLPSISSNLKDLFILNAECLLYTPSYEHFGIVPLEAMKFNTLVLADVTGGPTETILPIDKFGTDGTGWLKETDPNIWFKILVKILEWDDNEKSLYKKNGYNHIEKNFTREVMCSKIDEVIQKNL
ncbi:GDP-Man:Man(1)GlcNAc(2)-PP-dolichol alpha-1,3-mannosyltransferase [Ascoidea rubescens DSM 1968]|uniref:Alpha-1,3/1,6-mannosyltransferase ALG2 n=1 Tax=Ascoidea rubescens DSM 1968 TaxID=1344418 RepID=A0A1D2VD91_9ASCO|nr:glycosyltransferase family 4 protein [Ascoidea rubescens DSM 1968]ODV59605.1 glycosyltransferase family 4 protein [Ascoidea rubescens DSM 1968]